MGKEMGNNNTSAIKEEDNISGVDDKNLIEDTTEHANEISQENQNIPTSSLAEDATSQHGKVSMQEESCGDDVKEKTKMILIDEAKDVEEKAIGVISCNVESKVENDLLEGDIHESEISQEDNWNLRKISSDITIELGKDVEQEDGHDADDAYEKATWFDSNNTTSLLESDYSLEGDTHENDINMEIQMHPKCKEEDVMEKATTELGQVSMQEEIRGDGVEEKTQEEIRRDNVEEKNQEIHRVDVEEKTQEEIRVDNVEEENQEICGDDVVEKTQEEILRGDVEEKTQEVLRGDVEEKTKEEIHGDDVEEKTQEEILRDNVEEKTKEEICRYDVEEKTHEEILREDVEEKTQEEIHRDDVEEKTPEEIRGDDVEEKTQEEILRNDVEEKAKEEIRRDDVEEKTQSISTAEAKYVEEKAIGLISNNIESKVENDSFERDTHESEMNMENQMYSTDEAEDVEEKSIGMTSELIRSSLQNDLLKSKDDEEIGAGLDYDDKTRELEVQEDKQDGNMIISFTNGIDVQGNTTILTSSDDPLISRNSLGDEDEEEASVFTLNAENTSNDSEFQELPSVHHDEAVKFISEHSLQGNNSLLKDAFPNADSHFQQIKLDVSEKEMDQSQEKLLCSNKLDGSDGNEFVNDLVDASETTSDSPSIGNNNNEENSKALNEENKLSKIRSTNENPPDCKPDQCIKELQEYKSGIVNTYNIIGSNGETHKVLDSSVLDAYVSNSIVVSDESDAALEEEKSKVPEVEAVFLIAGLTVVDCMHEKGENHSNKVEDRDENPESSFIMIKEIEDTNKLDSSKLTIQSPNFADDEGIEKEKEDNSQHATSLMVEEITTSTELSSNDSIFANGGYETRDSVTRLSTVSNPDNLNITSQMQKSPSFNLNLRMESRREESDQIPLLCKSENDSLSNKLGLNLSNSMPHEEYDHVEEKIVTMERSYSEISKSSFIGFLKEEEESDLLVMEQTHDNNVGSKMEVKEVLSSNSHKGKEKGKFMSYFFTSCMCCATLPN